MFFASTVFHFVSNSGADGALPIALAAVELEKEGQSWLENTLHGKTVWFTTLKRNTHLQCIVSTQLVRVKNVFVGRSNHGNFSVGSEGDRHNDCPCRKSCAGTVMTCDGFRVVGILEKLLRESTARQVGNGQSEAFGRSSKQRTIHQILGQTSSG